VVGVSCMQIEPIPSDWDQDDNIVVAAATCPMSDCGALALGYRSLDLGRKVTDRWEFVCARCGVDFEAREGDLIFQSVPRNWLLAKARPA
jgi:hypothetical protein